MQKVQLILPFLKGFTMVDYRKIYFEAYINDQYIWHKNNTAQFFYMRHSRVVLELFQYTKQCPWYSQIFQQEVGLNHVN